MPVRVAIISPDPNSSIGGVERFCHDLARMLALRSIMAETIAGDALDDSRFDAVISNGMVSAKTALPRIHVYHGCWVRHMKYNHLNVSRTSRAATMAVGIAREIRGGIGACRVAVAHDVANDVRRSYHLRCRAVIENAIDTDVYRSSDKQIARQALHLDADARIALFVGRDEELKRPDLAVRAAHATGFELFNAGAVAIAGMKWLGLLDPSQMATALAAVDVLIAPSGYESCGLAVLEALAVGTPVVATRTGCVRELITTVPEYGALTAHIGDEAGLIRSMLALEEAAPAVAAASQLVRARRSLRRIAPLWEAQVVGLLA